MSFCSDVKNELTQLKPSECCKPSLVYGLMLFSRFFSYEKMSIQTNNEALAKYYAALVGTVYNINPVITAGGSKRPAYKAEVVLASDRLKILASFDYGIGETKINSALISKKCCRAEFIRGAFLACGNITDPEIGYRVDFSVKDKALAAELSELLKKYNITAKISSRAGTFVLYITDSVMIEDLLTLIGLSGRSLYMMDTKIIKELKNNINRVRNCDSGNISKTVEASINQRTAIDFLENHGKLYSLPQELLSVALLRRDNPDASLKELCRLSSEPITVSGINHRLQKIIALYNEMNK